MTSIPRITEGLNQFSPDLFRRMGAAIQAYEAGVEPPDNSIAVRAPSIWAEIIGFKYLNPNPDVPDNSSKPLVRAYEYMWKGLAGVGSGLDPEDDNFVPAYNMCEVDDAKDEVFTYLGMNMRALREDGKLFRNMPYINSTDEINDLNGNLAVGDGEYYIAPYQQIQPPIVRMWPVTIETLAMGYFITDRAERPDEPYVIMAFSATPMMDGTCSQI